MHYYSPLARILFSPYSRLSGPICPTSECSYADVVDAINRVGVYPGQTRTFVPNELYIADANIPGPFGPDDIRTTAIYNRGGIQIGIRNRTLSNHALHPGSVVRTVVIHDGAYHIRTVGVGHGQWGTYNVKGKNILWDPVDQLVADEFKKRE